MASNTGPAQALTSVTLRAGWNPVAFEYPRLTALAPGPGVIGMASYSAGAYQTVAVTAQEINAGDGGRRAFWIYATGNSTLTWDGQTDGGGNFLELASGWNLVSTASTQPVDGSALTPAGLVAACYEIQTDGTSTPVPLPQGTLQPGRAYWMFATAPGRLTWNNVTPTPTPAPSPAQPVTALTLTPQQASVNRYQSRQFTLVARYADGSSQDVTSLATWTSADPSVAALVGPGLFKGLNPYTTTVRGQYGGPASETSLRVVDEPTPGPMLSPTPPPVPGFHNFPLIVARNAMNPTRLYRVAADASFVILADLPFANDWTQLSMDETGNTYVPVSATGGVQRVTPAGTFTNFGNLDGVNVGSTRDFAGNLYVGREINGQVRKISPDGTVVTNFVTLGAGFPNGLAVDGAGRVWVCLTEIRAYNADGSLRTAFGAGGILNVGGTTMASCVLDKTGAFLYVAQNGSSRILKVNAETGAFTVFLNVPSPNGVAFGPDDRLYFTSSFSPLVRSADETGAFTTFATLPANLTGLTFSP